MYSNTLSDFNFNSFENIKVSDDFGYIDYSYNEGTKNYPDGILILHSFYVYKQFRGSGRLKTMLKDAFERYPEGTIVQVALKNRNLVKMFDRMKFSRVKNIEYWGNCAGVVNMQTILTKETLNLL